MSDLLAAYPATQIASDLFRIDGPRGPEEDTSPDRLKVLNAVDWNSALADLRAVEADLLASFQGEPTLAPRIADILTRIASLEGAPPSGDLFAANNLSDLLNIATARANLGSVQTLSEVNALIAAAGHLLVASNLSDVADAPTARANIGAGQVDSVVAGANVTVDATDPANPIVASTGGTSTGWTRLGSPIIPSSSSSVDFLTLIDSSFNFYKISYWFQPSADIIKLHVRLFVGGVVQASAGAYRWTHFRVNDNQNSTVGGKTSDNLIEIILSVGNEAGEGANGEIMLWDPSATTINKHITHYCAYEQLSGIQQSLHGSGHLQSTSAVDGITIFPSAGTFTTGRFVLWGKN